MSRPLRLMQVPLLIRDKLEPAPEIPRNWVSARGNWASVAHRQVDPLPLSCILRVRTTMVVSLPGPGPKDLHSWQPCAAWKTGFLHVMVSNLLPKIGPVTTIFSFSLPPGLVLRQKRTPLRRSQMLIVTLDMEPALAARMQQSLVPEDKGSPVVYLCTLLLARHLSEGGRES